MNLECLISGLITVSLLVYLTYALLKPEKFWPTAEPGD